MSTTVQSPPVGRPSQTPTAPTEHGHLVRWLVAAVVLLAAGLVALGAWVAVDRLGTTESDAQALVDDLAAAWSSHDSEAVQAVYAPDAVWSSGAGDDATPISDAIPSFLPAFRMTDARAEPLGDAAAYGDYVVSWTRFVTPDGVVVQEAFLTILQVEDGKIVRHWDLFPGESGLLANAVAG